MKAFLDEVCAVLLCLLMLPLAAAMAVVLVLVGAGACVCASVAWAWCRVRDWRIGRAFTESERVRLELEAIPTMRWDPEAMGS